MVLDASLHKQAIMPALAYSVKSTTMQVNIKESLTRLHFGQWRTGLLEEAKESRCIGVWKRLVIHHCMQKADESAASLEAM